jgi:23S rRNA pseudouridine2605 synthase
MSEERLQKVLARAGVASRRKAEELIREGRVTVNGQVAAIGDKADPERDSVKLDERRILVPVKHRYLLLNKPRGVMSTVSDPAGRRTVIDLVPPALRRALAPVGRLDFLTEGLLLLTDDGDLAQQVAHPSFGCWKTYEVKVRGMPDEEQLERLRAGIVLEGRRTAPCRITALRRKLRTAARRRAGGAGGLGGRRQPRRTRQTADSDATASWWSVELGEGRTRQIREMFQRIGHPVQKLRRVAIGPVADPDLPVGSLRELSEREVAALRKAGPPSPSPARAPRAPRPRREPAGTEVAARRGPAPGRGAGRSSAPEANRRVAPAPARRGAPRSGASDVPAAGGQGGRGAAATRPRGAPVSGRRDAPQASRRAAPAASRRGASPAEARKASSPKARKSSPPGRGGASAAGSRGAPRSADRGGRISGARGASRAGGRGGRASGAGGAAPGGRRGGPGRSRGAAPRRGRK